MTTPLVSVLIPVFNHEVYVEECIRSIWEQGCEEVEIIAIDDGSTDRSYEVLQRLKMESPLPMHVERQVNQGVVKTANKALARSLGQYVLCMASDDKLLPGALSPALAELCERQDVQFALFNAMYFGAADGPVYSGPIDRLFSSGGENVLRRLYVDVPKPILLQSTIVRRDMFTRIGGWNEDVVLDDWPIFIRLFECAIAEKATWLYKGQHYLAGYRIHGRNSHSNTARQLAMCEGVISRYCPTLLQGEAYANAYVDHAMTLLRRRRRGWATLLFRAISVSSAPTVVGLIFSKVYAYLRR